MDEDVGDPTARHMPRRFIRAPDDIWHPAREKATRHGTDMSKVIRAAVEDFARPVVIAIGDLVDLISTGERPPSFTRYLVADGPDGPVLQLAPGGATSAALELDSVGPCV